MFSNPQNHFFSGKCDFQSSGWYSYIGIFEDNWFKCPIYCQLIRGIDQIFDIIFPSGIGVYLANPVILGFDTLLCIGKVFTYSRPGFPDQATIFIRLFCVTVKIKSVVGNWILGVFSSENCVLYCSLP